MLRKIVLTLALALMINIGLFVVANWGRAVSLDTAFWWLLGILALGLSTMVLMAIDSAKWGGASP